MPIAQLTEPSGITSNAPAMPMVLHVRVVTETGGGPEKTILNSPRFLRELNYDSVCAYLRPPGDPGFAAIAGRADEANAALVALDDRGPFDIRVFRQLLKLCREHNVAIWHGHDYKTNFIGLMLRRFHRMKLVTTVHGWVKHTKRTPLYYWIDRRCLKRLDRVICVSEDLLERCREIGVKPERCELIENAIDTEQTVRTQTVAAAKAGLGFDPDVPLIGAVGRLSDEKAFDVLIDAVAKLNAANVRVDLAIAGEGDARPKLEARIAGQRHPERYHLLGHRNDVTDLYQAFDIFALSSLREGLPNVLLEAMALETPVVATKIAGIPRLIEDRRNGRLVEPGSVDQLAGAIGELIDNPNQRAALAAAGRQTIEDRYSFRRRMEKIAAIYDELLNDSKK